MTAMVTIHGFTWVLLSDICLLQDRQPGGRESVMALTKPAIGPRKGLRYNVSQGKIMATTMVHIRVDEKVKNDAAKALTAMGMSVSDAVRMLLVRVAAEKALPFEVKVPNARTVKAMQAANRGEGRKYKSSAVLFKDLDI